MLSAKVAIHPWLGLKVKCRLFIRYMSQTSIPRRNQSYSNYSQQEFCCFHCQLIIFWSFSSGLVKMRQQLTRQRHGLLLQTLCICGAVVLESTKENNVLCFLVWQMLSAGEKEEVEVYMREINVSRVRERWYGEREWWQWGNVAARNRGRRTGKDVLPYKSACVWCTAINLNDVSPPRACFAIQEPQRGLLACQGCSSFGRPPPPPPLFVEQLPSLELVAEGESDCRTPITCPCPQGLTRSQSLGANTSSRWSWDTKKQQASHHWGSAHVYL